MLFSTRHQKHLKSSPFGLTQFASSFKRIVPLLGILFSFSITFNFFTNETDNLTCINRILIFGFINLYPHVKAAQIMCFYLFCSVGWRIQAKDRDRSNNLAVYTEC